MLCKLTPLDLLGGVNVRFYTGVNELTSAFYELRGDSATGLYNLICLDDNALVMVSYDFVHVYAGLCALCEIVLQG